ARLAARRLGARVRVPADRVAGAGGLVLRVPVAVTIAAAWLGSGRGSPRPVLSAALHRSDPPLDPAQAPLESGDLLLDRGQTFRQLTPSALVIQGTRAGLVR